MVASLEHKDDAVQADAEDGGTALCLSGGGFRAMLFHLGALWRLNEAGYLPRLARISSVSGGSLVAGILALRWHRLGFGTDGVSRSFEVEIARPVRRVADKTIDVPAALAGLLIGLFRPGEAGRRLAASYRRLLFGSATLQDLPKSPRFVFNATNVQSGVLWRFSRPFVWDYRVGKISAPQTELAVAVAASSAFPPFLSPVLLRYRSEDFEPGTGRDLQRCPYTTHVWLTDGGVYDNLGLETAKRFRSVLVSDGGAGFAPEGTPAWDWLRHTYRILNVIDRQVRSLRKGRLMEAFKRGRGGTYWGITTRIADYGLPDTLSCPPVGTDELAALPTRLGRLPVLVQERLVNWGFAVCDAALRKHVESTLPAPSGFPYPRVGVG